MTKAAADGSKLLKLTITGVAESPSRDVADPTKNSKLAEMLHYGETQYLTTPAAIEHFVCMISQEIARISQFLPRETVTAMRCEEMTGTRKMLPVLYNVASDPLTARNFITDFPLFPPFALEFLSSIQPSTFPPTCPATTNTNITASIPTPIPMAFHQPPQQLLPPLSSPLFPSLFRSPFPLGNPLFPVIPTSTSMLPPTPATTKSPFAETEEERRANAALVSMGFADERQNMTYVRAYNSIPMAIAALLEKRNAAQQATSQHV
ncbi:hypothetical protein Pelo_10174 [Pelomyxa schiedti]|nr:hypothetical protein Pelo_10174 [Pelomyxa schiedti]